MSGNGTLDQKIISLNDISTLQKQTVNENEDNHQKGNFVLMGHSLTVHNCLVIFFIEQVSNCLITVDTNMKTALDVTFTGIVSHKKSRLLRLHQPANTAASHSLPLLRAKREKRLSLFTFRT